VEDLTSLESREEISLEKTETSMTSIEIIIEIEDKIEDSEEEMETEIEISLDKIYQKFLS
jgi:hypothetical protein